MQVLLGRNELRALDAESITELGVPSLALMESAAAAVAEEILSARPAPSLVAILCGPGNNGGDGLATARRLHVQGVPVRALLSADPSAYRNDAAVQLAAARNVGAPLAVLAGADPEAVFAPLRSDPAMVLVDALFGTGLARPVVGFEAAIIDQFNRCAGFKVALDLPSGMDADTGALPGAVARADLTVTVAPAKLGCLLPPARFEAVGRLVPRDIGLAAKPIPDAGSGPLRASLQPVRRYLGCKVDPLRDDAAAAPPSLREGRAALLTEEVDCIDALAGLRRRGDDHKGRHGHCLCIGGAAGFGGAGVLMTLGAQAAGPGLCTLLTDASTVTPTLARCPSAMARPCAFDAPAVWRDALADLLPRADAVAIGPGWRAPDGAARLAELLTTLPSRTPLVLDADALTLLADAAASLPPLIHPRGEATVLTPHPGEAARLLSSLEGDDTWTAALVQADRPAAVRRLAELTGATVLLKGASTLVCRQGILTLASVGNPGLAAGGSGDVLTGLLTGLLARGLQSAVAATTAAYLHGLAADLLMIETPRPALDPAEVAARAAAVLGRWDRGLVAGTAAVHYPPPRSSP